MTAVYIGGSCLLALAVLAAAIRWIRTSALVDGILAGYLERRDMAAALLTPDDPQLPEEGN